VSSRFAMPTLPRYVAIVNPGTPRWAAYERALRDFWASRGVRPDIHVLPWREVVPRLGDLAGFLSCDAPAYVRLESPGRDVEVTRLLLQAGDPDGDWRDIDIPKGLLLRPGLLHRGFCRMLDGLRGAFTARPWLTPSADPRDVAVMFDKTATAERLAAAGVPVPPSLPPPADATALLDAIRARRWPVAYVKLNTGSSATGIAVVHALDAEPWSVTTMTRIGGDFYNTRRPRRVAGPELAAALDFLLAEGAVVQQGIPMAQIDGLNFDLRVVVVRGRPAFPIFRLSPQPMTNLHLGGRRGDPQRCREAVPTRAWLDALDDAAAAAACFDSAIAGVDLVFERGFFRHVVLEVNAFGDFFPGWADERGRGIHGTEIEATARALGWLG
jgi:hypothetical protein